MSPQRNSNERFYSLRSIEQFLLQTIEGYGVTTGSGGHCEVLPAEKPRQVGSDIPPGNLSSSASTSLVRWTRGTLQPKGPSPSQGQICSGPSKDLSSFLQMLSGSKTAKHRGTYPSHENLGG